MFVSGGAQDNLEVQPESEGAVPTLASLLLSQTPNQIQKYSIGFFSSFPKQMIILKSEMIASHPIPT